MMLGVKFHLITLPSPFFLFLSTTVMSLSGNMQHNMCTYTVQCICIKELKHLDRLSSYMWNAGRNKTSK